MTDTPLTPDWWQASDGKWYPPESRQAPPPPPPPPAPGTSSGPDQPWWRLWWVWVLIALAVCLFLLIPLAFGDDDSSSTATGDEAPQTTTTQETTTTTAPTTTSPPQTTSTKSPTTTEARQVPVSGPNCGFSETYEIERTPDEEQEFYEELVFPFVAEPGVCDGELQDCFVNGFGHGKAIGHVTNTSNAVLEIALTVEFWDLSGQWVGDAIEEPGLRLAVDETHHFNLESGETGLDTGRDVQCGPVVNPND